MQGVWNFGHKSTDEIRMPSYSNLRATYLFQKVVKII